EKDSVQSFVQSIKSAIDEAYQAIEQPMEGTIITVMRSWAEALDDSAQFVSLESLLPNALNKAKQSLENTTNQLKVLKKNQVVDAGAKGFYLFIEGFTDAILTKQPALHVVNEVTSGVKIEHSPQEHSHTSEPMYRYCTEVLLDCVELPKRELLQKLNPYGNSLIVAVNRGKARIHIHTNHPDKVLSYLSSVGEPIQQKADDMLLQYHVNQQRKAPIALVTDSIADLPAEYLLENQIHVLPMNILLGATSYLDKLTLQTKQLFDLAKGTKERATSSQPTLKTVENLFSFLETRYEAILVITVAGKLSGTYYTVKEAAKRSHAIPIEVIDSRQNSAAQGLLVMNANEWIQGGIPFAEVVLRATEKREQLKILVSVDELDPMIDSGRIPQAVGKLAKQVNLKPIVSLDEYGEGKLSNFAFSRKGNEKKILREMMKVNQKHKIKRYAIIHVNNEAKAKLWSKKLRELLGFPPSYITDSSTVIAMSAGEGSVAVAYELGGDEK
ncbi:DegV family EDD domain-containing protein, partial [Enterococcus hulanensis]|uniref:DegV family protein n=1 Tax=Enterococcus hulanensis TaxID=2559929 RepID=UPI001A8D3456